MAWTILEELFRSDLENPPVRRILLYGPPGTGKTTFAARLASTYKRPLYSVTLTGDSMVQELIGHWVPKGKEFVWNDGPAIRAWREGGILVLNEIDQASGAVLTALYAVLDDPEIAGFTLPNGETVKPDYRFAIVATTNATPEDLPPALRDRFEVCVHIKEPHPKALARLPENLRECVSSAYRSFAVGASELALTYREVKTFASLYDKIGDSEKAAFLVWGDRARDVLNALRIGAREDR